MYILNKLKFFSSFFIFIIITIFVLLGNWQYEKYKYKMNYSIFNNKFVNKSSIIFLKNNANKNIRATINCSNQSHFILENQLLDHQIGYHLYTSCKITKKKYNIIFFRGWINKNKYIKKIKDIPIMINAESFYYAPVNPLKINKYSDQIKQYKNVIYAQNIGKMIVSNITGQNKYIFNKLKRKNPYIYTQKKNKLNMKPIKHLFYAMQWYFFSLTLFFCYIIYMNYIINSSKK